jgi:hypothetical protein
MISGIESASEQSQSGRPSVTGILRDVNRARGALMSMPENLETYSASTL